MILAIVLDLLLFPQVTVESAPPPTPNNKPKNIIFLVDKSGSMSNNSKPNGTKKLIEQMIWDLGQKDTFSVITFDNTAHTIINKAKVSEGRTEPLSTINKIEADGGTKILNGIEAITPSLVTENTTLILLTDGEDSSFDYANTVKTLENNLGKDWTDYLTIIPIAVGDGALGHQGCYLKKLAERTGSVSFEVADNGKAIEGTFNRVKKAINTPKQSLSYKIVSSEEDFNKPPEKENFRQAVKGATYGKPIHISDAEDSLKLEVELGGERTQIEYQLPPLKDIQESPEIITAYIIEELKNAIKRVQGIQNKSVENATLLGGESPPQISISVHEAIELIEKMAHLEKLLPSIPKKEHS